MLDHTQVTIVQVQHEVSNPTIISELTLDFGVFGRLTLARDMVLRLLESGYRIFAPSEGKQAQARLEIIVLNGEAYLRTDGNEVRGDYVEGFPSMTQADGAVVEQADPQ